MLDKKRIGDCFSKALESYNRQATAQQQINQKLVELLLKEGKTHFGSILEIGCGTGQLTQLLRNNVQVDLWHLNDLCAVKDYLAPIMQGENYQFFSRRCGIL